MLLLLLGESPRAPSPTLGSFHLDWVVDWWEVFKAPVPHRIRLWDFTKNFSQTAGVMGVMRGDGLDIEG